MSRKVEQRLDKVYETLPGIKCLGHCQQSCGPIAMTPAEWRRITEASGSEPGITKDLTCSLLTKDGKCSVYEVRPAICRLWAVEESMLCPWGCIPDRVLTYEQGHQFLTKINKVAGRKPMISTASPELFEIISNARIPKTTKSK
jgi:Fe-S-cluster containining protein